MTDLFVFILFFRVLDCVKSTNLSTATNVVLESSLMIEVSWVDCQISQGFGSVLAVHLPHCSNVMTLDAGSERIISAFPKLEGGGRGFFLVGFPHHSIQQEMSSPIRQDFISTNSLICILYELSPVGTACDDDDDAGRTTMYTACRRKVRVRRKVSDQSWASPSIPLS